MTLSSEGFFRYIDVYAIFETTMRLNDRGEQDSSAVLRSAFLAVGRMGGKQNTVKIFGDRDSPFSGYNGEVYLYNNLTGEKDYVCDLVDAHYLYIRWESENVFSVNNRRFEIKQGNITSLQ
mgnify:CR=1 FL=1